MFLPDVRPGQFYGFPRFWSVRSANAGCASIVRNFCSTLYAKAIAGEVTWADEMFGYVIGGKEEDLAQDFRDDAWGVPKSVVIDNAFDWQGDKKPGHSAAQFCDL